MNICRNCQHEFEQQQSSIQVCPLCGEPFELEAATDEIRVNSPVNSKDEEIQNIGEDDETFDIDDDDEVFEIDEDSAPEPGDTFVSTQDSDHQDDLYLPKVPIASNEDTESVDSTPFALTEGETMDGTDEDFDDDDEEFEVSEEVAARARTEIGTDMATEHGTNAEPATDYYDPDEKQPTIEIEQQKFTATSLDYAEREIMGLSADDNPGVDADYIISMNEKDSQLGSGASGVVYKATQKSLDRTVAIKLLKKQIKAGTQSQSRRTTPKQKDVEKFLYESQITAGLDHPNVITVHDLGVTSNNTLFYSMKLFEGGKDWSKDFDKNTLEENLDIFNDVCDAMRRAHRDRIIHRDLKPQNVLVGDFGEVQVTDWGLAIDLNDDNSKEFSGGGTPCYMAPEMSSHYLSQQEQRALKSKLDWTLENAPNSADEIQILKEKIAENEEKEIYFREQIGELSDVYVLGAILFQIASGYPPHLFQISDIHRRQWGSETGKNKVRRELLMSAENKVANYLVRNLPNKEARQALRDIALQAMAPKLSDRYQDVDELQQAVRDFRDFMRCIEDTHRGDREVDASLQDLKTYVNLNNAIHAYEGALENYPDYGPANAGLAKARFLFAERALKNQDFELGLSTMTKEAIEHQPDKELAVQLRDELVSQRTRRDRRKKLLFVATMASLVSIGIGILTGIFAANAAREAANALAQKVNTQKVLKSELESLLKTRNDVIELEVKEAVAVKRREKLEKERGVSELKASIAQSDAEIQRIQSEFKGNELKLSQTIANLEKSIAEVDSIRAKIDAEHFKESTQFNQYKDYLRSIARNLDEDRTKTKIAELFDSKDISLAVKNGWEIHHLYKQTNPATAAIGDQQLGNIVSIKASEDGNTMVALSDDGQIFQFDSDDPKFRLAPSVRLNNSKVISMDLSSDGVWLVAALEVTSDDEAKSSGAMPLVLNLATGVEYEFDESIIEKIRFPFSKPDSKDICQEKFYCRPQHVEILDGSEANLTLFMVDQRAQLGLNQIRCTVLDLTANENTLAGNIRKAKLPGQLFLKNPGQLMETGCLASAVYNADGSVVAAVAASHPRYAVNVISIDAADEVLSNPANFGDKEFAADYFGGIEAEQIRLDDLSANFAPTAMKILAIDGERHQLLIGNGNGEIADLKLQSSSTNSIALTMSDYAMLAPNSDSTSPDSRVVDPSTVAKTVLAGRTNLFASTSVIKRRIPAAPAHKSVVRDIALAGNNLVSTSETEIMVWEMNVDGFVAAKKLFGQSGKISSVAVTSQNNLVELYTSSNLAGNLNELRRWIPSSNQHNATIQLENFKTQDQTSKQIVCGEADKKPGSQDVVLAFNDGTLEFFSPSDGTTKFHRPSEAGLRTEQNKLSRADFNNGKFRLIEDEQQLLMYSNSLGLLAWNLTDDQQCDPIRMPQSSRLFDGIADNSSVSFSSDNAGRHLVSSHPKSRNQFLLWQRKDDGSFAVNEIGPIAKSGTGSLAGLDMQIQPVISPDGGFIACVVRLRNTFEVQIFKTSPSRNLQKLGVINGDARANFRSIHFLDDGEIVITQDRVGEGVDRITSLIRVTQKDDLWLDEVTGLPASVSDSFGQISIADIEDIGGQRHFVGFGIAKSPEDSTEKEKDCDSSYGERRMLVWNENGLLFDRALPFSRRIAPKFIDEKLRYFVAKTRSNNGLIKTEIVGKNVSETDAITVEVDHTNSAARTWHQVSENHFVVCGSDWFTLLNPNKPKSRLAFSRNNPANKIELADKHVLVQHQDGSVSFIDVGTKNVLRGKGFYRLSSISPSGKLVALAGKDNGKISIQAFSNNEAQSIQFESSPVCMTWIQSASVARNKFANRNWPEEVLVSAFVDKDLVRLEFRDDKGNLLQIPASYSTMPLNSDRSGMRVKSFSISSGSGRLVSILWDSNEMDRCDLWQYAHNDRVDNQNQEKEVPSQWFLVDDANLGQIDSIAFSEVVIDRNNLDSSAPRIVIGADNQGSKSIGLYAMELGLNFRTKPLLDLFVTDKLQKVDQIVGTSFSADGKTMLAMTSDRAQIRLTDGWQIAKVDADYEDRIRVFNNRQSQLADRDLDAELKATTAALDALVEPASLAEERQRKRDITGQLKAAEAKLERQVVELEQDTKKIELERRAAVMEEIQRIKDQINQLDQELNASR